MNEIVDNWDREVTQAGIADPIALFRKFVLSISAGAAVGGEEQVAAELRLMGDSFAAAQRPEEALIAYDELRQRFSDARTRVLDDVVAAWVGRARVLEQGGDLAAAITAYDEIVATYGDMDGPSVRAAVEAQFARAEVLHAQGLSGSDPSLLTRAIESYQALDERYGRSSDPAIQVWVAKALYNAGDAYGIMGADDDARGRYRVLVRRFRTIPHGPVQEVVSDALARESLLIELPEPPRHLRPHPQDTGTMIDLEDNLGRAIDPARIEELQQALEDAKRTMAERDLAAVEAHSRAISILRAYRQTARPFALLLRSFDIEAFSREFDARWMNLDRPDYVVTVLNYTWVAEERALLSLLDPVPLITVGNPADYRVNDWQIPRLYVDPAHWHAHVQALVAAAAFIVVRVDRASPGIQRELELIASAGREGETIVVLSRNDPSSEEAVIGETLRTMVSALGAPDDRPALLKIEHLRLDRFRGMVYNDELVAGTPASRNVFRELVERTERLASLEPSARVRHLYEQRKQRGT